MEMNISDEALKELKIFLLKTSIPRLVEKKKKEEENERAATIK